MYRLDHYWCNKSKRFAKFDAEKWRSLRKGCYSINYIHSSRFIHYFPLACGLLDSIEVTIFKKNRKSWKLELYNGFISKDCSKKCFHGCIWLIVFHCCNSYMYLGYYWLFAKIVVLCLEEKYWAIFCSIHEKIVDKVFMGMCKSDSNYRYEFISPSKSFLSPQKDFHRKTNKNPRINREWWYYDTN